MWQLPGNDSIQEMINWSEAISELQKFRSAPTVNPISTIAAGHDWPSLQKQLHEATLTSNPRIRVLATIYKYGYILRSTTIFRTYLDDLGSEEYNFLDLERCRWTVINDKGQKLEFHINPSMAHDLRAITSSDSVFSGGLLLPQRRGTPYSAEASISSFSSWLKHGLYTYRVYRKLYLEWLRKQPLSPQDIKAAEDILDERPSPSPDPNLNPINNFILPLPNQIPFPLIQTSPLPSTSSTNTSSSSNSSSAIVTMEQREITASSHVPSSIAPTASTASTAILSNKI